MNEQVTSVRGWRKLVLHLQALMGSGFAVIGTDEAGKPALVRMSLEPYAKGILGFLPGFRIRKTGALTLEELTSKPVAAANAALEEHIGTIPAVVKTAVEGSMAASIQSALGRVRSACNGKIGTLLADLSPSLNDLIKSDRNAFRKTLLQGLSERGSSIFAATTKRHVSTLVNRLREELGHASQAERRKAGPLVLPVGTRFHVQKGNMTVFVVEQPPQTRTLRVMEEEGQKGSYVTLHFPYVIFFAVLRGRRSDSMYAFFSKKPLRSLDDPLFCPATPNIFENFKVCFAPSAAKETQAEMVEASIESFWGGRFIETHDPGNFATQISIDNWAAATQRDPLFALEHKWRSANRTVGEMLKKLDADFLKAPAGEVGSVRESRVDTAIRELSETMANELVKVLYELVPNWKIDETALAGLRTKFSAATDELTAHAKATLGKEADTVLSDRTIRSILAAAMSDAIRSTRTSTESASAAAHAALKSLLGDAR